MGDEFSGCALSRVLQKGWMSFGRHDPSSRFLLQILKERAKLVVKVEAHLDEEFRKLVTLIGLLDRPITRTIMQQEGRTKIQPLKLPHRYGYLMPTYRQNVITLAPPRYPSPLNPVIAIPQRLCFFPCLMPKATPLSWILLVACLGMAYKCNHGG